MRCRECKGQLEPVFRGGNFCFNFCRICKMAYTKEGVPETKSSGLKSSFDPLTLSRSIIKKTHAGAAPVTRTAMEVFLMDGLWDCYLQGLKDGILLSYSQDVEQGQPLSDGGKPDGSLRQPSNDPKQNQ